MGGMGISINSYAIMIKAWCTQGLVCFTSSFGYLENCSVALSRIILPSKINGFYILFIHYYLYMLCNNFFSFVNVHTVASHVLFVSPSGFAPLQNGSIHTLCSPPRDQYFYMESMHIADLDYLQYKAFYIYKMKSMSKS